MHWIDTAIFIFLIVLTICVGIVKSEDSGKNTERYFLAGRKISLPGFIATLVTTWYGGILGVGENTVQYGIQTWFIFGFPYYVFAILFAIFLVPKIRNYKFISIPDHFRSAYGSESGIISAFFIFILTSPAPYILSLGYLFNFVFQIPLGWGFLLSVFLSLFYVWKGGLSAVVYTDKLQFIFMFGGFFILVLTAWVKLGAPFEYLKTLPENMLDPTGGNSIQYILVWFFIALWTFVDPGFHQRTLAANSQKTARNGILISIFCWFIFDVLIVLSALYGVAILNNPNPLSVYPELALKLLPPGITGIFFVGIFSTVMSTLDSFGLISASTFGRDILWRMENKSIRNEDSLVHIRKGFIITIFLSILLVMSIPSIVKLWYVTGSIIIPGLLIPFLHSLYVPKKSLKKPIAVLIIPVCVSFLWYIHGQISGSYLLNLEPFYPGISISVLLIIFNSILKKG